MSLTKGPWSGPVNNADRFEIQGDGRRIAVVDKIEDARLMRAAPTLLAALMEAESALMRCEFVGKSAMDGGIGAIDSALINIRAAIAKAGQS